MSKQLPKTGVNSEWNPLNMESKDRNINRERKLSQNAIVNSPMTKPQVEESSDPDDEKDGTVTTDKENTYPQNGKYSEGWKPKKINRTLDKAEALTDRNDVERRTIDDLESEEEDGEIVDEVFEEGEQVSFKGTPDKVKHVRESRQKVMSARRSSSENKHNKDSEEEGELKSDDEGDSRSKNESNTSGVTTKTERRRQVIMGMGKIVSMQKREDKETSLRMGDISPARPDSPREFGTLKFENVSDEDEDAWNEFRYYGKSRLKDFDYDAFHEKSKREKRKYRDPERERDKDSLRGERSYKSRSRSRSRHRSSSQNVREEEKISRREGRREDTKEGRRDSLKRRHSDMSYSTQRSTSSFTQKEEETVVKDTESRNNNTRAAESSYENVIKTIVMETVSDDESPERSWSNFQREESPQEDQCQVSDLQRTAKSVHADTPKPETATEPADRVKKKGRLKAENTEKGARREEVKKGKRKGGKEKKKKAAKRPLYFSVAEIESECIRKKSKNATIIEETSPHKLIAETPDISSCLKKMMTDKRREDSGSFSVSNCNFPVKSLAQSLAHEETAPTSENIQPSQFPKPSEEAVDGVSLYDPFKPTASPTLPSTSTTRYEVIAIPERTVMEIEEEPELLEKLRADGGVVEVVKEQEDQEDNEKVCELLALFPVRNEKISPGKAPEWKFTNASNYTQHGNFGDPQINFVDDTKSPPPRQRTPPLNNGTSSPIQQELLPQAESSVTSSNDDSKKKYQEEISQTIFPHLISEETKTTTQLLGRCTSSSDARESAVTEYLTVRAEMRTSLTTSVADTTHSVSSPGSIDLFSTEAVGHEMTRELRVDSIVSSAVNPYNKIRREEVLQSELVNASSLKDIEDKYFECSYCLENFKEPKLLPCVHRFCRDCLKEIIGKLVDHFNCPLCNYQCAVPSSGVDGFRTDFYIKSLLQYIQLQQSAKAEKTKECAGCSKESKITSYCFKCKGFLCEQCLQIHMTFKMMQEHKPSVLSLRDSRDQKLSLEKLASLTESPRCSVHIDKMAEICCGTCNNLPICALCGHHGEHRGHELHDVTMLAQQEREKIEKSLGIIEKYTANVQQLPIKVEKAKRKLTENVTDREETIQIHYVNETERIRRQLREIDDLLEMNKAEIDEVEKREVIDLEKKREEKIEAVVKDIHDEYDKLINAKKTKNQNTRDGQEDLYGKKRANINRRLGLIEKELEDVNTSTDMQVDQNSEEIRKISKDANYRKKRFDNFRLSAYSILASKNDWTHATCLPDFNNASDHLIADVKMDYPELKFLTHITISNLSSFTADTVCITEQAESVININGIQNFKGWKINNMATIDNGNIIITGDVDDEYTHLTVISKQGKDVCQYKRKNVVKISYHLRSCSEMSLFRVATTCRDSEVGIYDTQNGAYIAQDIRSMTSNWEQVLYVTCVAVNRFTKTIFVGSNNKSVFVLNYKLNYCRILHLPEAIEQSYDIAVQNYNLLICDYKGKRAWVVTTGGPEAKVVCELPKPDHERGDWSPFRVCTDTNEFIYTLWSARISGQSRKILTQHSQDGCKLLITKSVDADAADVSTVITEKTEKLLLATFKTGKMYAYGLVMK